MYEGGVYSLTERIMYDYLNFRNDLAARERSEFTGVTVVSD